MSQPMNILQILSLKQVLEMDVKHGWKNCYGITAKQALLNFEIIGPNERLTKKRKQEILEEVSRLYEEAKAENDMVSGDD